MPWDFEIDGASTQPVNTADRQTIAVVPPSDATRATILINPRITSFTFDALPEEQRSNLILQALATIPDFGARPSWRHTERVAFDTTNGTIHGTICLSDTRYFTASGTDYSLTLVAIRPTRHAFAYTFRLAHCLPEETATTREAELAAIVGAFNASGNLSPAAIRTITEEVLPRIRRELTPSDRVAFYGASALTAAANDNDERGDTEAAFRERTELWERYSLCRNTHVQHCIAEALCRQGLRLRASPTTLEEAADAFSVIVHRYHPHSLPPGFASLVANAALLGAEAYRDLQWTQRQHQAARFIIERWGDDPDPTAKHVVSRARELLQGADISPIAATSEERFTIPARPDTPVVVQAGGLMFSAVAENGVVHRVKIFAAAALRVTREIQPGPAGVGTIERLALEGSDVVLTKRMPVGDHRNLIVERDDRQLALTLEEIAMSDENSSAYPLYRFLLEVFPPHTI